MNRSIVPLFTLTIALFLVGCGPGGPKTYPVSGTVTIEGKPAGNIQISFEPVDSTKQTASGNSAADGTYTLFTGVSGTPGAMAGRYKVVLRDLDALATAPYASTPDGGGSSAKGSPDPSAAPETGGRVPKEYDSATDSPKEVEVTSGTNTINIEI